MLRLSIYWLLLAALPCSVLANNADSQPRIAIVIDDLGNSTFQMKFTDLPGALTLALLPHTPYAQKLAHSAASQGKEVIIHMPMQANGNDQAGIGVLTTADDKTHFVLLLEQAFMQFPDAVGMNNHMGSRLTELDQPMHWLMEQLALRDFYFLDSRTTAATRAEEIARHYQIPVVRRHIFLDNDPQLSEISKRWDALLEHAKQHGQAVAIGHPHRTTYEFLKAKLPELSGAGIELVFASELAGVKQKSQPIKKLEPEYSSSSPSNQ